MAIMAARAIDEDEPEMMAYTSVGVTSIVSILVLVAAAVDEKTITMFTGSNELICFEGLQFWAEDQFFSRSRLLRLRNPKRTFRC